MQNPPTEMSKRERLVDSERRAELKFGRGRGPLNPARAVKRYNARD